MFYALFVCGHYFFNTSLCKSTFSTYYFGKLVFTFLCFICFLCLEFWIQCHSYRITIFVSNHCWQSEKSWKILSVVFYCWPFWISLKACNYALCHFDLSLSNFWSPNKQLKYLGKWGKILIFQIFFFKCLFLRLFYVKPIKSIESITKKIPVDVPLYMRLLDQENKLSICVIRRRYRKTKNCPNSSFSNNFFSLESE